MHPVTLQAIFHSKNLETLNPLKGLNLLYRTNWVRTYYTIITTLSQINETYIESGILSSSKASAPWNHPHIVEYIMIATYIYDIRRIKVISNDNYTRISTSRYTIYETSIAELVIKIVNRFAVYSKQNHPLNALLKIESTKLSSWRELNL